MNYASEPGASPRRMNRSRQVLFFLTFILLAFAVLAGNVGAALAQDAKVSGDGWANRFLIRGRLAGVLPEDSARYNVPVRTHVSDQVIPEIDLSYFLTDNIA
ncbi:MAG: hypothetical protein ACU0C8_09710, partial [Roseovarius sp.]